MKIAIISPWAISKEAIGGTERFIVDLATELSKSGHRVVVFMLSGVDWALNGVTYTSLNILGPDKIASEYDLQGMLGDFSLEASFDKIAQEIGELVQLDDFDVLHINSLIFLKSWREKRRIFTIHTNPFEYKLAWGENAYRKTLEILGNEAKSKNTVITAPSLHYAKVFARIIGWPIHCIPNAIDSSRLHCVTSKSKLLSKYGLESCRTTILLPNRLEPIQKRPQLLFKALHRLGQEKIKKLQVIASGLDSQYGVHGTKLQKFAETHSIKARFVHFETMAEAYRLADINHVAN